MSVALILKGFCKRGLELVCELVTKGGMKEMDVCETVGRCLG